METPEKLEAIELLEECVPAASFGILDIDTTMIRLYHAGLLEFSPRLHKAQGDHHVIKVKTTSKGKELIKDYRAGKFAKMTATLTFNLPEETEEHQIALDGRRWKAAMWDFRQALRSKYKHGCQESFSPDELIEMLREAHEGNDLQME